LSSGLFLLYTNSQLGVGQWRWIRQALLPGLAPYGVGYGLAVASQGFLHQIGTGRLVLIPALAALLLVYAIVLLIVFYVVFCHPDERQTIKRLLGRVIPLGMGRSG